MVVCLGTAVLLWPAFVNRQPFLFTDTTAYVRGADAIAITLVGSRSEWSGEVAGPSARPVPQRPVLAGRSIYYGLGLWLSQALGGFWAIVAVQALLVCVALAMVVRRTAGPASAERPLVASILMAALAIATPLGFFASFAMPDVFAALALIAVAMLTVRGLSPNWRERMFWLSLLTAACLFHSANILTVAALLMILLAIRWVGLAPITRKGVLIGSAAVAIGLAGEAAFDFAVERTLGAPAIRPPFVMARVIDDGPGYRHLRSICPAADPFVVCRFLPVLPQPSDTFLWSADPRTGVFMAASPAVQRALAAEQYRFVASVIAHRPIEQLTASLASAIRQAGMIGLPEFNYEAGTRDTLMRKLPPDDAAKQRRSLAFRDRMPVLATEMLTYVSVAASVLLLLWLARGHLRDRFHRTLSPFGTFSLALVAGILINDVVCGAMSTPHDRYAARVVWLIPMLAMLAAHACYGGSLRAWSARRHAAAAPAARAP